jgi:DNA topoisomerase-1
VTWVEKLHATGIVRRGGPRTGFRYVHVGGGRATRDEIERIRALHIPPAWKEVAVSRSPQTSVQAVGRDRAGRWQYLYHAAQVRHRERRKFERLLRFGTALPRLRRALAEDLRKRDLARDTVLAHVVRILACAFIRPGSEVYAAENGSYGIATLRRKHVSVTRDCVSFDFPAKSGKRQQRMLRDARTARMIRRLLRLPGYEVFKYVDADGAVVDIKRADINEYIKRHMGDAFSAKDFRTWTGTLICACALARAAAAQSGAAPATKKKVVVAALKETARQLGNTPAICRSSYVSPCLLSAYERDQVVEQYFDTVEGALARTVRSLHASERSLLRLLQRAAGNGAHLRAAA